MERSRDPSQRCASRRASATSGVLLARRQRQRAEVRRCAAGALFQGSQQVSPHAGKAECRRVQQGLLLLLPHGAARINRRAVRWAWSTSNQSHHQAHANQEERASSIESRSNK